MKRQIEFALAHPVFDPERQIVTGHYWRAERDVSACLTVNIGMERQVYAGGRPLWHLSLAVHDLEKRQPVSVLRWSPTTWRKMEALRDRIMFGSGTSEPWIAEKVAELAAVMGRSPNAMQWRKPLSIEEINRMAPTEEVRRREGRP